MAKDCITVVGAREHNLKSVDVTIPKGALTVITGPSGSGKSSLALDTLYAEGKRRYVESLSSYARQFLGVSKRPDVDKIDGLCPAIAIDQKTVGFNPRSTVGTITEIYDYLRVLFARVGVAHCVKCSQPIQSSSPENIMQMVLVNYKDKDVIIASPLAIDKKGEFKTELALAFKRGFFRFVIDGVMHRLDDEQDILKIDLKKNNKHTIFVLVDRMAVGGEDHARLAESVEKAIQISSGICAIIDPENIDQPNGYQLYSSLHACLACAKSGPELEPRLFSFNSPIGACRYCNGIGFEYHSLANDPNGEEELQECYGCHGARLKPEALAVKIGSKNIYEFCCLSLDELHDYVQKLSLTPEQKTISMPLLREITQRIEFLVDVGLAYLTLGRPVRTLSGGEGQRIRLATQIGSALTGVLYILDEPSIGLHQRDNDRLILTLKRLRDLGNTVVVVEHDMDTIRASDYVIDIGPAAGILGGRVMAAGTPAQLMTNPNSLTGKFLSGERSILVPDTRRTSSQSITITKVTTNNLKEIDVEIPLGVFVAVSGVSGSGKSSLIMQTLAPALKHYFSSGYYGTVGFDDLQGIEAIRSVVLVDQTPIGRTPRSNPSTYLGFFDEIRALYANLPESNARGYGPGRFSFNVPEGRCFECGGDGTIKISMHFLEDVVMTCKACRGKRFNAQTLEILYKGKNIADVLDMSVLEARTFFEQFKGIAKRLELLCDVGLDYLKLGQPSTTLSGGEAQRIKLVNELAKRGASTLYILDEPTTGLHSSDVEKLLMVLNRLVERGNTLLVIEHNLDVLKCADWIIDIGPEGGRAGGHIVCQGTPEVVAASGVGYTSGYLKHVLDEAAALTLKKT
jgi:excinuclease ABC subunit A